MGQFGFQNNIIANGYLLITCEPGSELTGLKEDLMRQYDSGINTAPFSK